MKKNEDAYCDFDGWIYPFAICSSRNSSSALSSCCAIGYTLQSTVSGVFGLSSIAWSHGRDGGNLCDASSLNRRLKEEYSAGTTAFSCCLFACISRSVDIPQIVQSCSNSCTMRVFSSSECMVAITGYWEMRLGLIELITMGNIFSLIVAVLQCNVGSKVANQGYPKSNSSRPRSATRKRIS